MVIRSDQTFFSKQSAFLSAIQLYILTSALLATLCFLGLLPLVILGAIQPGKRYRRTLIIIGSILPATIFAALILLLVDNFTYTLIKYGIASTKGWSRALYGLGFILIIVMCYRSLLNLITNLSQQSLIRNWGSGKIIGILVGTLLLSFAIISLTNQPNVSAVPIVNGKNSEQHPNILLITSDGVDATHMSVYGYGARYNPCYPRTGYNCSGCR